MVGLGLVLTGSEVGLPATVVAAIAVLIGLFVFAANVLMNARAAA